jgi:hypothetical protein
MVLQVRQVLDGPVFVNIRVTCIPSTIEAVKEMFFVQDVHAFIFPPCFRCTNRQVTNKGLVENSAGISTVSMCVISRYISAAKCTSPDDTLIIVMEFGSTRFRMDSRNFFLHGTFICPRRQAFTTISSYSRLSCSLRHRTSLLSVLLLFLFFWTRYCFLFFLAASDPGPPGSSTCFLITFRFLFFFEKERSLNASPINREKGLEYTYLRVETRFN